MTLTRLLFLVITIVSAVQCRSFGIDYDNDVFLKDGQPFRYVSASIHYFRVPRALWLDRLTKIRAAGFNAIQFVIPWNIHERYPGQVSFEGELDVGAFLEIAKSLGLYALVRPGPYICAEHNGGGLPWWLYGLHPKISLRSSDADFLHHSEAWWNALMPKLKPHLYINGGNILMIQMENEYGSYGCDFDYTAFLRDQAVKHLGKDAQLYTTDGAGAQFLKCGKIAGVYATIDFGHGYEANKTYHNQRLFEPRGPLVNSEYYPAWLDYWGLPHNTLDANTSAVSLEEYLKPKGSNVNIYMAHGGTSFGFENGANVGSTLMVEPTSYDYDGLISEAGDLTPKYFAMKKVIAKHLPIPKIDVKAVVPKGKYGKVNMKFVSDLLSSVELIAESVTAHQYPLNFEALGV